MFGAALNVLPQNSYDACTGCSLCLLVCPVWRKTHDVRLTPHGRAKALQHGATVLDIAESIESCTLCGACEPVCPERIDLVGMTVGLRRQLPRRPQRETQPSEVGHVTRSSATSAASGMLLAGSSLRAHATALSRIADALGLTIADDDGTEISFDLETGSIVSPSRVEQFLEPLRRSRHIVVDDGLLHRHLRAWLPRARITSLGVALSSVQAVRQRLRATDLYVIEARGYHADYERHVRHYDELRAETGCTINLDLQRIAIPATAHSLSQRLDGRGPDDADQARWILHGRQVSRIVVESESDMDAFAQVTERPVIHVAQLLDADGEARTAW